MSERSNVSTASMNPCVVHWQYLVTYSQDDESKFSIRESFGEMLKAKFNASTSVVTGDYWACSREEHQNDGFHYHCTLKLTGCTKWLSVKNKISEKRGVCLNFSDEHNFFLCPFRYVCKRDQEVAHNVNHPPYFWQLPLQNPKIQLQNFLHLLSKKKKMSIEEESSCGVLKKQKVWPTWI